MVHLLIVGGAAHDTGIHGFFQITNFPIHFTNRGRTGDCGQCFCQDFVIRTQQTVLQNTTAGGRLCDLMRRLDAADDDVGGTQFQHLLLCLGAGAFPNRQHRNHGKHTEHNPQHCQPGPQLMQH